MEIIKSLKQTISLANAILSKFTPSDSFLQITKKYEAYAGELTSVEQVNVWCKEKTNGLIKDIINDISTIELIILNAVSFKGEWYHKFKSKDTYKIQFYNEDSSQSTVQMMKQIHTYNYYEDNTVQIIEMKYVQEDVSAVIILPNKEINLNKYINEVFSYDLLWKYNKELKPCDVELHLPKFIIASKFELNEQLKELGIISAFDPSNADFYNITPHGGLYVSDVIQKAFIKVDEEGTEAAVTTAVIMVRGIDIKFIPEKTMVVDRPFLFMIKHKKLEKEILFIGKIVHLNNVSEE
jgi:serine protease inhibitor